MYLMKFYDRTPRARSRCDKDYDYWRKYLSRQTLMPVIMQSLVNTLHVVTGILELQFMSFMAKRRH